MRDDEPQPRPSLTDVVSIHQRIDTKDLVYFDDGVSLNFMPRAVAEFCVAAQEQLATAKTWGDARRTLARDTFDLVRRDCYDDIMEPDDDEPLPDHVATSDGWPRLTQIELRQWLPADIWERFGEPWSGLWGSGINLSAESWMEIEEALDELGIAHEYDSRVEQLCSTQD